ncbi:MAG: hypothetical protein AAF493_28520 [Pseudomonadota bacterium]
MKLIAVILRRVGPALIGLWGAAAVAGVIGLAFIDWDLQPSTDMVVVPPSKPGAKQPRTLTHAGRTDSTDIGPPFGPHMPPGFELPKANTTVVDQGDEDASDRALSDDELAIDKSEESAGDVQLAGELVLGIVPNAALLPLISADALFGPRASNGAGSGSNRGPVSPNARRSGGNGIAVLPSGSGSPGLGASPSAPAANSKPNANPTGSPDGKPGENPIANHDAEDGEDRDEPPSTPETPITISGPTEFVDAGNSDGPDDGPSSPAGSAGPLSAPAPSTPGTDTDPAQTAGTTPSQPSGDGSSPGRPAGAGSNPSDPEPPLADNSDPGPSGSGASPAAGSNGPSQSTGASPGHGPDPLANGDDAPNDTTIGDGEVLNGTDPVEGELIIADGGTVAPGNSPGTLIVENFVLAGGTLEIEFFGDDPSEIDRIHATGEAYFDTGTIEFHFMDGYVPALDDILNWFIADGGIQTWGDIDIEIHGLDDETLAGIELGLDFHTEQFIFSGPEFMDDNNGAMTHISTFFTERPRIERLLVTNEVPAPTPLGLLLAGAAAWLIGGRRQTSRNRSIAQ